MWRIVLKIVNHIKEIIYNSIHLFINLFKIYFYLYKNKYSKIWVLDIDNTLADTWPTLLEKKKYKNELHRLENLNVLTGSKNYFLEVCSHPNHGIIFLSARPLNSKVITQKWLENNNFWHQNANLILVPKAKNKLPFLNLITLLHHHVFYIDDLSYNHENGTVKFYDSVIKKVNKLNLFYYDNQFIQSINK